jgi:nucleotide-binding universal stress UspA family protein
MDKFQIKTILMPTDFSETGLLALNYAAEMAQLFKAKLHLLHVIEVPDYVFNIPEAQLHFVKQDSLEQITSKKIEEIATDIRRRFNLEVVSMCSTGRIPSEVISYAEEQKADIIVMGTHGAKGLDEYFLGSNAFRVVERAACPVITIQRKAGTGGFKEIVLPIDNLLHSREKTEYTVALASRFNARVHILGLLETEEPAEIAKFNIKLDTVEESVKKGGLQYIRKIVHGNNLAQAALDYSETAGADLIAILEDQESKLGGIGPFAKQIVNHSRIPVLSIKPREGNFESLDLTGNARIY